MRKSESSVTIDIHMHLDRRHPSGFIDIGPNVIHLDGSVLRVPACKV